VLAEVAVLRVGIDDLDEGYFANQALRVLQGQVPYRDFDSLYTPGLLYLHAAIFALLGGPSLLALRVVSLIGRALLFGMTYVLGQSLARPWWAAVPPILLLAGLDAVPNRWEPHPGWLSTGFALLAVWLLPRRVASAGAAAGLAFAFKQNTGVFLLVAVALFTWLTRASFRAWLACVGQTLAGFGLVTLAWLLPLLVAIDGELARLAPFIGGVNQAALFSPPEALALLPLAAGVLGLWWGWTGSSTRHPLLAWYVVAGWSLFLTEYPRMDVAHLAWSAPLLLVLGAIAVDHLPGQVGVLALSAVVLGSIPSLVWRSEPLREPVMPISDLPVADAIIVPTQTRDDLVGTVREIQARTEPREPIFVYPASPLLYVLAERPNATRYDHIYPDAAPPAEVAAVIRQLAEVRLVVTSDFWRRFFGPPGTNAPLEQYLATHYQEVARYGAYHVLVTISEHRGRQMAPGASL
jgi:hypothetical protein